MKQFSIDEFTAAKLTNSNSRAEMHGADLVPAIDLTFIAQVPNFFLDQFDPDLRRMYYSGTDEQANVPDVAATTALLRCAGVIDPNFKLKKEFSGYKLEIDHGLGKERGSNIEVGDCKVNAFSFETLQGGFVKAKFRVQASGIGEKIIGKCGALIGHEVRITLTAPNEQPAAIDGTVGHPGAAKSAAAETPPDATDIFAQAGYKPAAEKPAAKKHPAVKKPAAKK